MGIFGGVVTAIIAGGDTDTILRAGARFIDPDASRPAAAAVIVPRAIEPTFKTAPLEPTSAPIATAPQEKAALVKPIVGEPVHIKPEVKVAARAPEPKPDAKESKAEPKPEPKPEVKVAAKAEPKPEPKAAWTAPVRRAELRPALARLEKTEKVAEKAEKPEEDLPLTGAKKRRDELASAAAANALAKAQLEGSL